MADALGEQSSKAPLRREVAAKALVDRGKKVAHKAGDFKRQAVLRFRSLVHRNQTEQDPRATAEALDVIANAGSSGQTETATQIPRIQSKVRPAGTEPIQPTDGKETSTTEQ